MAKKRYSNRFWFWCWAAFHSVIIAAFLISLLWTKRIVFDADYTNMLPSSTQSKAAQIADKAVSSGRNSTVFILVSHEDFSKAKECADTAYNLLKDETAKFKSVSLYSDFSMVSEIKDFLGGYRFNILDAQTQSELKSSPQTFAENALAEIFGGFSMASFEDIEDDPFLLDEKNLSHYMRTVSESGTSMSYRDGVLACEYGGRWYVMLRAELTEEGAQLASKKNAVPLIYEKCLPLEKDGIKLVFHGTPYHSYKSSSSAYTEISVISAVALLAVVAILLAVFRSGYPVVCSIFSILLSVGTAFCATHFVFGQISLIALVFGTSLIGSCIDYCLHYFINWKASKELETPKEIRKHLLNGLVLSLLSTELCFFLLFFAPFTLLKQMALFSFVGILSSFLTVIGLFTKIPLPPEEKREIKFLEKLTFRIPHQNAVGWLAIAVLLISSLAVIFFNRGEIGIHNDISNLYKMEGRLKDDMILANSVLGYNPTSWLVVEGDTIEDVLQTEERIMPKIPDNFICTAKFIPSKKSQSESVAAAKELIPFAGTQFEYLGFGEEEAAAFEKNLSGAQEKTLTPETELPPSVSSFLDTLWIGNVDGKYYSIVLPSIIGDESVYKEIALEFDSVYYENRVHDVSAGLDKLTAQILVMFAIAFVIIAVVMKFFYGWLDVLKILSIPISCISVIVAVFALAGLKIDFFAITGLIIVLGLGLDYVIYKLENKENVKESFAIFLSFFTTAISFGALSLSSFVPVHVLGLSIFSGLITAFICAIL